MMLFRAVSLCYATHCHTGNWEGVTEKYAPIIGHPLGDVLGDLNDYFTQEVGEMRRVWFPKTLHHGENMGLCKLRVTSLCNSFANVFNLLYACKFLPGDDLIVENIVDSNSRQYCDKHSVKVQANVAEVQPEEERPWERGWQWYCV